MYQIISELYGKESESLKCNKHLYKAHILILYFLDMSHWRIFGMNTLQICKQVMRVEGFNNTFIHNEIWRNGDVFIWKGRCILRLIRLDSENHENSINDKNIM